MVNSKSGAIATLIIERGTGDGPTRHDEFEVPFEDGASLLDGLIWIRENVDASLAFRYSCISANVCKECVLKVDGETRYACLARLDTRPMQVGPMPNKRRLRDLACDTVPPKERLDRIEATDAAATAKA